MDNVDLLYKTWEVHWGENPNHNLTLLGKLMLRSKQNALKKTIRMLDFSNAIDVGCGLGYTLKVFKNVGKFAVGIDVSSTAIKVCRSQGLDVKLGRLENIKEKYDLVFCDGLLEHFLNFETIVRYLVNIGNRYILIFQTDHANFFGKTLIYLSEIFRGSKNIPEYNYQIEDFVSVFERYNFKLTKKVSIFLGTFKLLLFEKKELI